MCLHDENLTSHTLDKKMENIRGVRRKYSRPQHARASTSQRAQGSLNPSPKLGQTSLTMRSTIVSLLDALHLVRESTCMRMRSLIAICFLLAMVCSALVPAHSGSGPRDDTSSPLRAANAEMGRLATKLAGDWNSTETMERGAFFPEVVHAPAGST